MSAPGKTGRERVKRRPDSRPGGRARLLRALELELVALVTRDRLLILVHRMALIAVRDTEMVIVRIGGLHLRGLSDELIPRMTHDDCTMALARKIDSVKTNNKIYTTDSLVAH